MSQIEQDTTTGITEDYQNGESCLSSKGTRLSYLKLAQAETTSFHYPENGEEATHTVADAKPEVFDAFIAEVVEEMVNVDRERWDIYERWDIINACLRADVLTLTEDEAGSLILAYPEVEEDQEERIATEPLSSEKEG